MTRKLIRVSRINKAWFLLFPVYLLTSCTFVPYKVPDIKEMPGVKTVVLGRIKVVEGGRMISDLDTLRYDVRIHILPDAGPEPIPYGYIPTGDGSFYWQLPSGGYVITDFILYQMRALAEWRGILARFVVPEGAAAIYIGTLTITAVKERTWKGDYSIRVEDHYDQAVQRLKERFPEISGPVTRSLMELR